MLSSAAGRPRRSTCSVRRTITRGKPARPTAATGASAVQWTAENVPGVADGRRELFLMGHSAGAHIAALLALGERYLGALAQPPQFIDDTLPDCIECIEADRAGASG